MENKLSSSASVVSASSVAVSDFSNDYQSLQSIVLSSSPSSLSSLAAQMRSKYPKFSPPFEEAIKALPPQPLFLRSPLSLSCECMSVCVED